MNMYVLDIHGQVLKRTFRCKASKADKIPFKRLWPDAAPIQQAALLHQPINLFVIDDPAHLLKFTCHVPISITAELLVQGLLDVIDHYRIFKELTILINAMGTGFDPFCATGGLVIEAAATNQGPLQQFMGRYIPALVIVDQAYRFIQWASLFFKSSVLNSSSKAWFPIIFLSLAFSSIKALTSGSIFLY